MMLISFAHPTLRHGSGQPRTVGDRGHHGWDRPALPLHGLRLCGLARSAGAVWTEVRDQTKSLSSDINLLDDFILDVSHRLDLLLRVQFSFHHKDNSTDHTFDIIHHLMIPKAQDLVSV